MRSTIIAGSLALAGIAAPTSAQYYAAPEQPTYSAPRAAPIAYYRTLPALPSGYDRSDWMRDCHAYLDERRRRGRDGAVIGGLIGGAGGAVLGNELAEDGSRLTGTLIGGGIGGIAGAVIGSLIARGGDDDRLDCDGWLTEYHRVYSDQADYGYGYGDGGYGDDYAYRGGGYYRDDYRYGYRSAPVQYYNYRQGSGYGAGYGYAAGGGGGYVTTQSGGVVVIIEDRGERYIPVIREEIVEEYYEVQEREVVRERVIERVRTVPQPRPDKRIKYVKQR